MPRSCASTQIKAAPTDVFRAFIDPAALVEWLPPGGMTGHIHEFDARVGGGYRMSLYYPDGAPGARGKTGPREDMVTVRFVELRPPHRIVETARFHSDDPALQGEMTIVITLEEIGDKTEVTMQLDNLPPGLRPEDNDQGARLSLEQLARWIERP
jgi:uncharacterized protein YndB with AHSA1/START domain